jgi:hypothetical protein
MINEHDIQAFQDEIWESLSESDKKADVKTDDEGNQYLDLNNVLTSYTRKVAELLSQKCDNAWYYDAANLIRQTAGIPVSVSSDVQLSMKLHPEDDPE